MLIFKVLTVRHYGSLCQCEMAVYKLLLARIRRSFEGYMVLHRLNKLFNLADIVVQHVTSSKFILLHHDFNARNTTLHFL